MTTTDPLTETAVEQLDRLASLALNARNAFAGQDGTETADPVAAARLIATAADAADRLMLLAPECFP
jgi:hypothetical protein